MLNSLPLNAVRRHATSGLLCLFPLGLQQNNEMHRDELVTPQKEVNRLHWNSSSSILTPHSPLHLFLLLFVKLTLSRQSVSKTWVELSCLCSLAPAKASHWMVNTWKQKNISSKDENPNHDGSADYAVNKHLNGGGSWRCTWRHISNKSFSQGLFSPLGFFFLPLVFMGREINASQSWLKTINLS